MSLLVLSWIPSHNEQVILIVPIMTFCVSFYMVPGDESFAKKSKVIWILRSMIVHVSHLVVPGMAYLQHDFSCVSLGGSPLPHRRQWYRFIPVCLFMCLLGWIMEMNFCRTEYTNMDYPMTNWPCPSLYISVWWIPCHTDFGNMTFSQEQIFMCIFGSFCRWIPCHTEPRDMDCPQNDSSYDFFMVPGDEIWAKQST